MGLLDPFWTAVDTTIAGAGSAVGGAIGSVGDGISQTGRNVGDGIAGAAGGWGGYVNDTANYVRDATGAGGVRTGSASNPLGLARDKDVAKQLGFPKYTPYKGPPSSSVGGAQRAIAAGAVNPPPRTIPGTRSVASANAAQAARERALAAREKNAISAAAKTNVTGKPAQPAKKVGGTVTGRPDAAKGIKNGPAAAAAKKPAPATQKPTAAAPKPPTGAAQAAKKTGGTVTGRPTPPKTTAGAAKKPTGTVTGRAGVKK